MYLHNKPIPGSYVYVSSHECMQVCTLFPSVWFHSRCVAHTDKLSCSQTLSSPCTAVAADCVNRLYKAENEEGLHST